MLCLFRLIYQIAFNLSRSLACANGKEKNQPRLGKEKYFAFHLVKLISIKYQAA